MISTNIDGTVGGANQLLDLLAVVSNPSVYEAKLKALQDAIDENKKFVEALAPASEIVALRDASRVVLENAKAEAKEIKAKADAAAKKAQEKADAVLVGAAEKAAEIKDAADADRVQAAAIKADADKAQAAADQATTKATRLAAQSEKAKADAKKAKDDADAIKAEYAALKQELIDKHKAFIASL